MDAYTTLMKQILTSTMAIALSAMALQAKPSDDDEKKSKDGRTAVSKKQAPGKGAAANHGVGGAKHSGSPSVAHHGTPAVHHPVASEHPSAKRSPQVVSRDTVHHAVAPSTGQRTLANSHSSRTVVEPSRSTVDTRRFDTRNVDSRHDSDNQSWDRSREQSWRGYRYFNAPPSAYRGWDHGHSYSWNHQRYHWFGGSWVLIDPGYDYNTYVRRTATFAPEGANLVAEVQVELHRAGYNPGPSDGVMGGRTHDAIARYQADNGLSVTARIDRPLLASLKIES
jgi:hypothetical protein